MKKQYHQKIRTKLYALLFCIVTLLCICSCDVLSTEQNQVSTPTFSPPGGNFNHSWDCLVSISCGTIGSEIRYTIDGSQPTIESELYTNPIVLMRGSRLKAIAYKSGMKASQTADALYSGICPKPIFSIQEGSYYSGITNSISYNSFEQVEIDIRYTTDGSNPTMESELYIRPLILQSTCTLKARSFVHGWNPSEVTSARYQVTNFQNALVHVPSGTFNPVSSYSVTLSPYSISKYETTQSEYVTIMGTNPSYFVGNTNLPVESVSWFDAIEYCNRRSISEGLEPCYVLNDYGSNPDNWYIGWDSVDTNRTSVICDWSANGYRLPTEMEWMNAARGGQHSEGYEYSGSDDVNLVAWNSSNSEGKTHFVGGKQPNEIGLYDMSGNVSEWVWDFFGSYPNGLVNNPTGPDEGYNVSLRGGSWSSIQSYCSVSIRLSLNATYRNMKIGFRVVRNNS